MEELLKSMPIAILVLVVGFVFLVAMGTSMPELAVSVSASIIGNNTLAISNVTGSNIFNLMVVIGICAIMAFIPVEKNTLKIDFPLSIIAAIVLLVMGTMGMKVGRIDGIILALIFIAYIVYMIMTALKARKGVVDNKEEEEARKAISVVKCIIFIIIGVVGIVLGGELVVESATAIATNIGISQTLIGLTIVAIGTSLPELVTSIVAARKKDVGVALGNAIGSNIFNVFMILGVAGTISPMAFLTENIVDIIVLIVFSVIVWIIAWKANGIKRTHGIIMVALYAIYMVYICIR